MTTVDPAHLASRVVEFLRVWGLLAPGTQHRSGTHFVVAASGGRDSTVLAYLAADIARTWHCTLTLATVHHGLREEADQDVAFVASLAREFGAGFLVRRVDVRGEMLRNAASLQDAARRLRYGALEEMCEEAGADVVLTAHHADDQAETLLGHFLRGAGADGLAGIRPVQGRVARPLLDIPAAAIAAYAELHDLAWMEDASNATDDYRRNAIRHHIAPAVTSVYGPGWVGALGESARLYRLLAAFLEDRERALASALHREGASVVVSELALNGSSEFEKLSVCRLALRVLGSARPSLADSFALLALLSGMPGSTRQLSGGITARRTRDGLLLLDDAPPPPPVALSPGRRVSWDGWTLSADEVPLPAAAEGNEPRLPALPVDDPFEEVVDLDAVGERWKLRAWTSDDRFEPFGFGREKAIGAFLADAGIGLPQRRRIPVLEGARGVFWICGVRLAEHARVHSHSRRLCRVRYSINDSETP